MPVFHAFRDVILPSTEFRAELRGLESEFTPIGLNLPLAVRIHHVYTGQFPRKGIFGGRKDMLVTSAMKDVVIYNAAPRAVNLLRKDVEPNTAMPTPAATEQGTPLISYTPAVTSSSTIMTIDMVFDQFPEELFGKVSSVLQTLAGIPAFIPAAGYLLAASSIVKISGDLGHKLLDGRPVFSVTETIDFDVPGTTTAEADFRILANPSLDVAPYKFDTKKGLVDRSSNDPYDGNEPYVVISLDGKKHDDFAQFTPTAASATLLEKFLNVQDGTEATIDAFVQGIKLFSDSKFRAQADAMQKKMDQIQDHDSDQYKELEKRRNAFVENILDDVMKPK